ncbi:MAG: 30S ribosomal protein S21 [Candidatus Nealsonbacteria bacterium CG_4_8_14_3_um_filter_39_7]|nr:MAG: 30S ribosomal protein S21 [Candidatus Nealsonbacteria bacterium CG_4_8_14_3_um_filter_39_7]
MQLEVKKQERENSQSLLRRFTKGLRRSGVLMWARKGTFFQNEPSRNARKKIALKREIRKKEYEQLRKLGKLVKVFKKQ